MIYSYRIIFLFLGVLSSIIACTNSKKNDPLIVKTDNEKLIIAHRGASGYLPEHTLPSKAMAYAMHPDYIEQDLVLSKDNIPIVIHDIYLELVTDVATIFPERHREDGRYYVIDFNFNELKKLSVTERIDAKSKKAVFTGRFPIWKSQFRLHSFKDEIEMIQGLNKVTGNSIGIYPEIKNPKFHINEGKDISKIVLQTLSEYGYKTKNDKCILQCFDASELKRIRNKLSSKLFLVQLIESKEEEKLLKEYATYANGIGPSFWQLMESKTHNKSIQFSSFVKECHELNLEVHAYTFREDQLNDFSTFDDLLDAGFFQANLDGIFTDFPDKAKSYLTSKTTN